MHLQLAPIGPYRQRLHVRAHCRWSNKSSRSSTPQIHITKQKREAFVNKAPNWRRERKSQYMFDLKGPSMSPSLDQRSKSETTETRTQIVPTAAQKTATLQCTPLCIPSECLTERASWTSMSRTGRGQAENEERNHGKVQSTCRSSC